ncbi:D-alanyl-D-alanine carboxypeptidase family protein [Reyranella sp.]|uniref:D-alanyl-D-alanine carboxypeptidase family protein n=1 Tax=Reyranella sp. TaxID=1929291 RepID=UPI003C7CF3FE
MNVRLLLCILGLFALSLAPARAQIAPVASPSGPVPAGPYVVVDVATGEALLDRSAGTLWYPASLTKMMTLYIVFEELKAGRLQLNATLSFTENARTKPSSHLGLAQGRTITVEQGIQALVARSANDVATAFGERLSGSEPTFGQRMTETAQRLGMTATTFRNANGLPDPAQTTTARDMAILALAIIKDFPQYYGYFRTKEFMLGNQLIGPGIKFLDLYSPYADGFKTGFICASGFNIVGSAVRDGRRLVAVAFGFRRADLRDEFLVRLFDEAYALKTGGNRQKVWQLRNGEGGPVTVLPYGECGGIRYDMPGDAVWLGTFGDWRTAKNAFDAGQAKLMAMGVAHPGKEYILPVTSNKVTKQAAIIADLEPATAQRLCAEYQARKSFCVVKKPSDFSAPYSGFWR